MKDNILSLALSDIWANHILFLGGFKRKEYTVLDMVVCLTKRFKHEIKNRDLSDEHSCDHSFICSDKILGSLYCDFYEQEDGRVDGYKIKFHIGQIGEAIGSVSFLMQHDLLYISEGLLNELQNFIYLKINPIKKFGQQKASEVVFYIKRQDKQAIKFPINRKNIARLNRLLLKSNYLSIFFFYKPKFLYYLYDYFSIVGMFEECSKIDDTINRINLYFKPKDKIEISL